MVDDPTFNYTVLCPNCNKLVSLLFRPHSFNGNFSALVNHKPCVSGYFIEVRGLVLAEEGRAGLKDVVEPLFKEAIEEYQKRQSNNG